MNASVLALASKRSAALSRVHKVQEFGGWISRLAADPNRWISVTAPPQERHRASVVGAICFNHHLIPEPSRASSDASALTAFTPWPRA